MKNSAFTAIGIDIGGTKIAAGLVTLPEGKIECRHQVATRHVAGGEAVLAQVESLARGIQEQSGKTIDAIGAGLCEIVDLQGRPRSGNCVPWEHLNAATRLGVIAPATLEADVRAAAMAEAMFGAGRGSAVFLYITIGTGISCCLVLEGEPFRGARGATGTMASGPLDFQCTSCGAINRWPLEEIASGPALVEAYHRAGGVATSAQEVLAAAHSGDARAVNLLSNATRTLGAGIAWLINVLDPERVVIGGGLGLNDGEFWELLLASTRDHIWWPGHRDLPIQKAATGRDAGILGAAIAAWKASRFRIAAS